MSVKSALSSTAVLLLGALALTACQSGSSDSAGGSAPPSAPSRQAPASTAPGTRAAPASDRSAAPTGGTGGTGSQGSRSSQGSQGAPSAQGSHGSQATGPKGGGGTAADDAYAYKHPCAVRQLSVHVVRQASAPTQRVIEVRNAGPHACGLSYYPRISLDDSHAADGAGAVRPLVPSGLGGPPAYPVYAGQTVYAVVDLDPSGATTGTVKGVDELNVLADGDHMPNADTLNFPLGSGARVLKPKLGLYRSNVADAVASMRTADAQL